MRQFVPQNRLVRNQCDLVFATDGNATDHKAAVQWFCSGLFRCTISGRSLYGGQSSCDEVSSYSGRLLKGMTMLIGKIAGLALLVALCFGIRPASALQQTPCFCGIIFSNTNPPSCDASTNRRDEALSYFESPYPNPSSCYNLCMKRTWYSSYADLCSYLMETSPTPKMPWNGFVVSCAGTLPTSLNPFGEVRKLKCPPEPGS